MIACVISTSTLNLIQLLATIIHDPGLKFDNILVIGSAFPLFTVDKLGNLPYYVNYD